MSNTNGKTTKLKDEELECFAVASEFGIEIGHEPVKRDRNTRKRFECFYYVGGLPQSVGLTQLVCWQDVLRLKADTKSFNHERRISRRRYRCRNSAVATVGDVEKRALITSLSATRLLAPIHCMGTVLNLFNIFCCTFKN